MNSIFTVKMPDIGEGVVEGEVITWLKKIGDPIAQDEPVVVVMTDKATVELPSPKPGFLAKQYYKVGEIAIKDKPLYDIKVEQGEKITAPVQLEGKKEKLEPVKLSQTKTVAAPTARKLAKDLGVDIAQIAGSGKEGQVTKEDVQHFIAQKEELPESFLRLQGDTEMPLVGIQQLMAKKVTLSKKLIPHFSFFDQADATRLAHLKDKIKEDAQKEGINLTFMPFFIKALSLCITKYPIINSSIDPKSGTIILHKPHHVGIAMSTEHGLVVAVIKNVETMTLSDIVRSYDNLKKKGKEGKLLPSDMKESTITITNFGAITGRGLFATPIINYPEVAILGVAKIHKAPVVVNEEVVVRDVLNCSWSFDHRIIDGYLATKLSYEFVHLIENPASLLDS